MITIGVQRTTIAVDPYRAERNRHSLGFFQQASVPSTDQGGGKRLRGVRGSVAVTTPPNCDVLSIH